MYQSAGLLRKNRGLKYQAVSPHLGAAHLPSNICLSIQVHLRKCFPPLASNVLVLTSKLQRASLQRVGPHERDALRTGISGTFVQGKVRSLLETLAIAQRRAR